MSWLSQGLNWLSHLGGGGQRPNPMQFSQPYVPGGFNSTQPVYPTWNTPQYPGGQGQSQGGGFLGLGNDQWATILALLGTGLNIYGGVQQANAQNKKTQGITDAATGMFLPTVGIPQTLASINPGNDALMQFLRADPSRQFDTSGAFTALEANDQRQIDQAANSLRAGYAGLGQRFGTASQRQEGRLRDDFAAQIAARNAGIAQGSFEAAQSRSFNAAQLFSQLASGIYGQNVANNRDLLAIMAGLPPAGSAASAIGSGLTDIGQLIYVMNALRQPQRNS